MVYKVRATIRHTVSGKTYDDALLRAVDRIESKTFDIEADTPEDAIFIAGNRLEPDGTVSFEIIK